MSDDNKPRPYNCPNCSKDMRRSGGSLICDNEECGLWLGLDDELAKASDSASKIAELELFNRSYSDALNAIGIHLDFITDGVARVKGWNTRIVELEATQDELVADDENMRDLVVTLENKRRELESDFAAAKDRMEKLDRGNMELMSLVATLKDRAEGMGDGETIAQLQASIDELHKDWQNAANDRDKERDEVQRLIEELCEYRQYLKGDDVAAELMKRNQGLSERLAWTLGDCMRIEDECLAKVNKLTEELEEARKDK